MSTHKKFDQNKLDAIAEKTLNYSVGMTISAAIYIGNKLGLYKSMMDTKPVTSFDLAKKLKLNERILREWLHGQVTAGLIEYDHQDETYFLSPEAVMVLADDANAYFQAGSFSKILTLPTILKALEETFKTGIGFSFDISGEEGAQDVQDTFAPWFRSTLIDVALPELNLIEKLTQGMKVADIGCGAGIALIEMAKKFPNSQFFGYDISTHALDLAETNKTNANVTNVTFYNANETPLPEDKTYSFITAFDCLHDMADPQKMIQAIEKALHNDGTFFLAEFETKNSFVENMRENPFARHMYSWSLLYCLPSSLASKGGVGLGTCGLHEDKLNEFLKTTKLSIAKKHNFNNPITAYYEIKFS